MAEPSTPPGPNPAPPFLRGPAAALRAALSAAGLPFGRARKVAVAGTSPWARRLGRTAVGGGAPADLRSRTTSTEEDLWGAHLLAVWDPRRPAPRDPTVVVARALGVRPAHGRLAGFVTTTAAWIRPDGRWTVQRLEPSDLGSVPAPAAGRAIACGPHRLRRLRCLDPASGERPIDVVPWVD